MDKGWQTFSIESAMTVITTHPSGHNYIPIKFYSQNQEVSWVSL